MQEWILEEKILEGKTLGFKLKHPDYDEISIKFSSDVPNEEILKLELALKASLNRFELNKELRNRAPASEILWYLIENACITHLDELHAPMLQNAIGSVSRCWDIDWLSSQTQYFTDWFNENVASIVFPSRPLRYPSSCTLMRKTSSPYQAFDLLYLAYLIAKDQGV